MKKLLALLLALVMLLSFAACSKDTEEKNSEDDDSEIIGDAEELEDQFDENSGEKLLAEYRELSEQYVAAYKEDHYSDKLSELDRQINAKASEISDYKAYLIGKLGDEADAEIDAIEAEVLEIATEKMAAISGK